MNGAEENANFHCETFRRSRSLPYVDVRPRADTNRGSRSLTLRSSKMISPALPEEKLAILQAADLRRKWHSLDDQRVCVLCDRTITGRQIEVTRDPGGTFSVHCPTEGCPSVPNDWFYQGNACSTAKNPTMRMGEATLWSS